MRGAAPVSAGGSAELERLKTIAQDPDAMKLLESDDDPAEVLDALRALGGDTGSAVSGYLDLVGYRLLDGFDISEPAALELPDALLRSIRIAVDGRDLEGRGRRRPDRRRSRARSPRRTAPSSTSCSGRPGSCTGSATSAASTATSGRRG